MVLQFGIVEALEFVKIMSNTNKIDSKNLFLLTRK